MTRWETASRKRERDCKSRGRERGNYSGDIDPAATRQPLSLDSLDSDSPIRLHSVYLSTSSSSPSSPCFPSVALHHSSELLFDLLLLFLFFVFLSCSWSFPSLPPLLFHAVRGAVHPSSLLDRRTRKHQHQRDHCSLLCRMKISDTMQLYNLAVVPQWTLSPYDHKVHGLRLSACTCWRSSVS